MQQEELEGARWSQKKLGILFFGGGFWPVFFLFGQLRNNSGRGKHSDSFLVSTLSNVEVSARMLRLQFVLVRVIVTAMTSWRRGCARFVRRPLQSVSWAGYEVVVTVSSSACKCGTAAVVFVLAGRKSWTHLAFSTQACTKAITGKHVRAVPVSKA